MSRNMASVLHRRNCRGVEGASWQVVKGAELSIPGGRP